MTPTEVNKIDLSTETNVNILKELVRYWENEAYSAVSKLEKITTISNTEINETFNMDIIRKLMK